MSPAAASGWAQRFDEASRCTLKNRNGSCRDRATSSGSASRAATTLREGTVATAQGKVMRKFSFRPALMVRGRKFKGLRGWAGKPFQPPLTDITVGAYMLVAAFDLISFLGQDQE